MLTSGSCSVVSRWILAIGVDSIAFPKTAMKPPRPAQEGAGVVHCLVQSPEGNFERLAYWTAGLQILPHSLYVKLLWYTFI